MNDENRIKELESQLAEQKEKLERLVSLLSSGQKIDPQSFDGNAVHNVNSNIEDVSYREVSSNDTKSNDTKLGQRREPTLHDNDGQNEHFSNDINHDIQKDIQSKNKLKDNFFNFKNMIASSFVDFTNEYGFKNKKVDWYSLGKKIGIKFVSTKDNSSKNVDKVIEVFTQISEKANVTLNVTKGAIDNIKTTTSSLYDTITLIGNKRKIKTLQKKFSSVLDILGFEASELYADAHKNTYISNAEIETKLSNHLETIKFTKQNGKYVNDFLKDVNDENKATMIYSVIWPNLAEKIHQGVALTSEISNFQKDNKYLKIITNFARKNKLSSEDVTNVLMADKNVNSPHHIFSGKKDIEKLKEHINPILENIEKFTALANNNALFIQNMVQATEDLKEVIAALDMNDNRKLQLLKSIDESVVFTDSKNNTYKYITIRNNISQIIAKDNLNSGLSSKETEPSVDKVAATQEILEKKETIESKVVNEPVSEMTMKP